MNSQCTALTGAAILWKGQLVYNKALLLADEKIVGLVARADIPTDAVAHSLDGGILAPGFVDLQVNGGGGVMFNDAPTVATLQTMSQAHARIGATTILPTLITDTPEIVSCAIDAVEAAIAQGVAGIAGLHLEGPHLCPDRKGAHDGALIRKMNDADLDLLIRAASRLPALKVTLAPESVTLDQIRQLAASGILVSLGHTNADYATCAAAAQAGARCVTHLFNAQRQMENREPGTVGAALALGALSAGIIADGEHVHPASMLNALRAKSGPGEVFLVSDAMATAGSHISTFLLNGREIRRSKNRLTLADGTLAGAHLELADAVRFIINHCHDPLERALARATSIPAEILGLAQGGQLLHGTAANIVHLSDTIELQTVWQNGRVIQQIGTRQPRQN